MGQNIDFFYTLAKISATLVGLIFVAVVSFHIPNVSRVRNELKGFSPLLKIRFPDYLINITTSNLTILFLPLLISFNFILIGTFLRMVLDVFFIIYILACFYYILRFNRSYLRGDRHAIKKTVGTLKYYRVILLPPLVLLISLIVIFVINIPEISDRNGL